MKRFLLALLALCPAFAAQQRPDIIILVWDDVGYEDVQLVPTPNYDALAAAGVTFDNARSHAWCSPSRDSLLFSRIAGEGRGDLCASGYLGNENAAPSGPSLASEIKALGGYDTYLIGKYHLGRDPSDGLPWYFAPHARGFDHWYAGRANSSLGGCAPQGRVDDGIFSTPRSHHTLYERDAVFQALDEAHVVRASAFIVVGHADAHAPWDIPPASIMPPGYVAPINPTDRDKFEAEIMGLDHVLGEIVAYAPPTAWVIVVGDNGTPQAVAPDPTHAKLTVFERGVRVPLLFYGPGLTPASYYARVQLYDIAPTLLAGLGASPPPEWEGVSFLDTLCNGAPFSRPWVYMQNPSDGLRAVADQAWKLIDDNGVESLYNLFLDPLEQCPLPAIGPDAAYLRQFINQ